MLILVDLLLETKSNSLFPIKKMVDVQKITIAVHTITHVEELVQIVEDNDLNIMDYSIGT